MSLKRQFLLVFTLFSLLLTAAGGWIAWREMSRALDRELDQKLLWVAGASAEVGFDGEFLPSLQPGSETSLEWLAQYERLRRLQRYVSEAYLFDRAKSALVTTEGPDAYPVGTPIYFLDLYPQELERAWTWGEASTPLFRGLDGRWYKYGLVRVGSSEVMLAVLMRTDYMAPLELLRQRILVASLLAAIMAAGIAWLLSTNVVRPLERLSRVAMRIQMGRMSDPVGEERGVELGRLSRAMERMRRGVVQRDEQLRLMLAQVAHEIRNPLGGVELFAAAAMESDDPSERARLLGRVRREVEGLNQIIQNFLTFARPLAPNRELHDARDPVREAAELAEAEMAKNGTRLHLELPVLPLMARADPDHVKRVVLNLLRNAGAVAHDVWVDAGSERGEVRIRVRDSGPGIPETLRENLFEPFVTDKEQGAGLGLAIVKRMVLANGGRIELAEAGSVDGGGAEFHVYWNGADDLPPDPRLPEL
jgi:signal transduction histidine kinase